MKSKKPALKAGFSNLAPLTGIAFASNSLIGDQKQWRFKLHVFQDSKRRDWGGKMFSS
ncbi:hypothetical protein [Enterobacter bugandensis]|uniref:hypothetical protein n=1 Tax=Enterobacter bugandensis TaxID=881260 RepID=UPI0012B7B321|nr:hypothetical protein [Enterobacter bugandensis]